MQVKKFEAPTLQEALDTIKRELGPEAIILQTKTHKRGFGLMNRGSVEVTAAVSERSLQKKKAVETKLTPPVKNQIDRLPAAQQAEYFDAAIKSTQDRVELSSKRLTATRYIDIDTPPKAAATPAPRPRPQQPVFSGSGMGMGMGTESVVPSSSRALEEELKQLKRMLSEVKAQQDLSVSSGAGALASVPSLETPALQDAFEQLVVNGVDRRHAHAWVKKVAFDLGVSRASDPNAVLDQLAAEVMESVVIGPSPLDIPVNQEKEGMCRVLALVGPTGVGKTTTLAKIASEAILKRGLKVGLINLDAYKVAAFDQLGTYAKILNVPFRSVATPEDLSAALKDFQSLDLVLVDTTGRSQKDPDALRELKASLDQIPGVETSLVLSVTTRDSDLMDMATRFGMFRPQGLIFSKLDETNHFGSMMNLTQKVRLPIQYFTTGQRVPEDIEEATRERMAALVLDL